MGKMKAIHTEVMEMMEDLEDRLAFKDTSWKLVFIEGLINKLEHKKYDIMNQYGKED